MPEAVGPAEMETVPVEGSLCDRWRRGPFGPVAVGEIGRLINQAEDAMPTTTTIKKTIRDLGLRK